MNDISVNLSSIAKKIVKDCLLVKPGENFWISCGDPYYYEFAEELALAGIEAGSHPFITISSDRLSLKKLNSPEDYLRTPSTYYPNLIEIADVQLKLCFPKDPSYLKDVSPTKLAACAIGSKNITEAYHNRNNGKANLRCSSFVYPTPEAAKKYGMSFKEYSNLIWNSIDINYKELSKKAKKIANIFKNADKVHITTNDGTNLKFSVKGRKPLIDDGIMDQDDIENNFYIQNLPTGEVYMAPIEDSTEGTAVFQYNVFFGKPLVNLKTTFKEGRMTKITADEGQEHFNNIMKGQGGEKFRIAELGIGLNPCIKNVIGELALDEKIIGTIHIAVGENRMFGGLNTATIHQDLVMKKPTVTVDGNKIMEKGNLLL